MDRNFTKEYIEISNAFRSSKGSKIAAEKLFDLLYDVENSNRTKADNITLSNIYGLLGFHESAYSVFKAVADLKDKKTISKLYAMAEIAKSHKNIFAIKDSRKFNQKKEQTKLLLADLKFSAAEGNILTIADKDIVIFNKDVANESIKIGTYGNPTFENQLENFIAFIFWLGDCKEELIACYNKTFSAETDAKAGQDWYDTLEVYGIHIGIAADGHLFAEVAVGDVFVSDHILDIEIDDQKIMAMHYSG